MDQDERAEGAAVSAPAGSDDAQEPRTSDEIRSDIDDTREEVGDTVQALAAKTDVRTQARENPIPVAFGAAVLVAFLIGRRTGRP